MNDECSVWRDHRTAARPPEDSTRRLYVDAYTGDEFFTVCFPWGNEKMAGVVGGTVEDPCQGKWLLVKAFLSGPQPWEPSHIFVFEYVPAQPRIEWCPLYSKEDVVKIKEEAYERGYETARITLRLDDGSGFQRGYKQAQSDLDKIKEVAYAKGYEAARTTYNNGRADERSPVHTALRQLLQAQRRLRARQRRRAWLGL